MLATEQVTIVLHIAVLGQKLIRLTYLIVLKVQATVFLVTMELKQTDAATERRRRVNKQISIQKDSRPSEFTRPLTSFTLYLNGDLNVTASSWPPRQFA